ncbi:hypothetical protein GQ43DRAFT_430930 [Delitschia confertaspora ATCC 74209]|uniref:Uncharacterized protein n=1 Tax=Delitschia confertaspora ATCC 74209 TaxID=1513339 RepID=A0A9P4JNA9_9PLEO|nr:hypothetical protein GQ43DRAFT_430930 [Delitschia confertaspora ATCC 74209]
MHIERWGVPQVKPEGECERDGVQEGEADNGGPGIRSELSTGERGGGTPHKLWRTTTTAHGAVPHAVGTFITTTATRRCSTRAIHSSSTAPVAAVAMGRQTMVERKRPGEEHDKGQEHDFIERAKAGRLGPDGRWQVLAPKKVTSHSLTQSTVQSVLPAEPRVFCCCCCCSYSVFCHHRGWLAGPHDSPARYVRSQVASAGQQKGTSARVKSLDNLERNRDGVFAKKPAASPERLARDREIDCT